MKDYTYSIVLAWIFILLALMSSCATRQVVLTNTEVTHDTTFVQLVHRDSIYQHDSIYIREFQRGDTCFVYQDRWNVKYRDRHIHDSVYVNKTDTVKIDRPVEVEKPLTIWQGMKMKVGGIALAIVILGIIGLLFTMIKKKN